jgi:hypothetical protein
MKVQSVWEVKSKTITKMSDTKKYKRIKKHLKIKKDKRSVKENRRKDNRVNPRKNICLIWNL